MKIWISVTSPMVVNVVIVKFKLKRSSFLELKYSGHFQTYWI